MFTLVITIFDIYMVFYTFFGSTYKNKLWIYKQYYTVMYITDKAHENVACMSSATKLNKKSNKPCHDFCFPGC